MIKIHVPMEVRHHKHTHTITKNFHHYHKPRKALKDITSQDLKHEHVHLHYRGEDNQLLTLNDVQGHASHGYEPSSSNKNEKVVFHDNFVNIENEALELLASEVQAATASPSSNSKFRDIVVPAASVQSSSSTKLPPVARSRTHANTRRRSSTTKKPAPTTTSSQAPEAEAGVDTDNE